jgi:hypothetical protein
MAQGDASNGGRMGKAKAVQDRLENAKTAIRQNLSGDVLYPLLLGLQSVERSSFAVEDGTQTHHMDHLMGEDVDEKEIEVRA